MVNRLLQIRHASEFRRDQRGAALVEFSISILLMLTVLFMTFELCSAIYTSTVLAEAANEGIRYWIVHSSDADGGGGGAVNAVHDLCSLLVA